MDLRVHRNDEPYWIGKPNLTNLGAREEINPYVKSENIAPAEPVRMEVDHSLFGVAGGNPQFNNETFSMGTKRKTRTKCNCVECNPVFAGNPNPTPNVFQCNICQKCFTKCKYFRRHVGLHGKTKTLKCDLCQVSFMFSYQLQSHRLTHTHGQKPFQCNICQKCFTKCKYFRRHVGLHGKTKTLKCDLCQVSFMFSYQLQSHRLTHTHGQKPFQCNICRKSFTSKYYLKQHEWVHNPITPFKCRVCGKGYSSEGYFKRHELSHAQ